MSTTRLLEAASWCTLLMEQEVETTPEFEAWLRADSANLSAWEQVRRPWEFIGEQQNSPELLELRRAALANARTAARERWVGKAESIQTPASLGWAQRRWLWAASLVACLTAGFFWYLQTPDVYRTAAGERRVVTLADGSQLQLDSSTAISVAYTAHERKLVLLKGQGRFDVAHDVERPFSVSAAGHKVIATGTAFDVDLLDSDLTVTLIEGHVMVLPEARFALEAPPSPHGISLNAGQQVMYSGAAAPSIARANLEHATAWQNGQLVFDNEPLGSVIARINRYTPRPLVVEDPTAAALLISGVFNTGDVDGLIDTLTHYLPIEAQRRGNHIFLRHR